MEYGEQFVTTKKTNIVKLTKAKLVITFVISLLLISFGINEIYLSTLSNTNIDEVVIFASNNELYKPVEFDPYNIEGFIYIPKKEDYKDKKYNLEVINNQDNSIIYQDNDIFSEDNNNYKYITTYEYLKLTISDVYNNKNSNNINSFDGEDTLEAFYHPDTLNSFTLKFSITDENNILKHDEITYSKTSYTNFSGNGKYYKITNLYANYGKINTPNIVVNNTFKINSLKYDHYNITYHLFDKDGNFDTFTERKNLSLSKCINSTPLFSNNDNVTIYATSRKVSLVTSKYVRGFVEIYVTNEVGQKDYLEKIELKVNE